MPTGAWANTTSSRPSASASSSLVRCSRVRSAAIHTASAEPAATVTMRITSWPSKSPSWSSPTNPSAIATTPTAATGRGPAASAAISGPSTYPGTKMVSSPVTESRMKSAAMTTAAATAMTVGRKARVYHAGEAATTGACGALTVGLEVVRHEGARDRAARVARAEAGHQLDAGGGRGERRGADERPGAQVALGALEGVGAAQDRAAL